MILKKHSYEERLVDALTTQALGTGPQYGFINLPNLQYFLINVGFKVLFITAKITQISCILNRRS